jgi:hypothetical protein
MPTIITRGAASALQYLSSSAVPAPQPLSSLINSDPNVLVYTSSFGTRSPADKISNYVIFNSTNLIVGVKYCYIMGTDGDSAGNRVLANGTVISSRAYNSGSPDYTKNSMLYQYVKNGVGYQWTATTTNQTSSYGTFTYNPKNITAGDGSTGFGHLIAKNTYNATDPGKGGASCWALPYDYFYNMCSVYSIPFVDNNDNSP